MYSTFSRRSLRRMNVEIRTSFENDRGKRQKRRDLFDFYLYRWRVSAILKETGGASFLETSYFSPLCIHTRRNTATDIRRSRTDEYEGTRRRIDVIIGGGRKREREREMLCFHIDACTVTTYYCCCVFYTILPRGLPREYKHSEFII